MAYKWTPLEKSIMAALHRWGTPEAAADATGIPLDVVKRVHDRNQVSPDADGPHSMEQKLNSPYGGYWREFEAAQQQVQVVPGTVGRPKPQGKGRTVRPRRQVRIVPDDRNDEFGFMLDAITGGIIRDGEKDEGQGVA